MRAAMAEFAALMHNWGEILGLNILDVKFLANRELRSYSFLLFLREVPP
jgi:hypothetical protein